MRIKRLLRLISIIYLLNFMVLIPFENRSDEIIDLFDESNITEHLIWLI